jgi:hypothetical protein
MNVKQADFWNEITQKSENFNKPVSGYNSCLLPVDREAVFSILKNIYLDSNISKSSYLRFYQDGKEDFDAVREFLKSTESYSDIDTMLNDYSKNNSFGLIINGSLRWQPKLVEQISDFLTPIYKGLGKHEIGFDLTFFIGNYGYTPFGVHLDDKNHRTIITNLGPNSKKMLMWNLEDVRSQYGEVTNISDVDSVVAPPKIYDLKQNDYVLIPSHEYYHVGLAEDISITAALIIHRENHLGNVTRELNQYLNEIMDYKIDFNSQSCSQSWISYAPEPSFLQSCIEARRLSNGGAIFSPMPRNISFEMISKVQNIVLNKLPILYVEQNENTIHVFARGVSKRFTNTDWLKLFFEKLNRKGSLNIHKSLQIAKSASISSQNVLKMIVWLFKYHAIELR